MSRRFLIASVCAPLLAATPAAAQDSVGRARHYLEMVMNQYHTTYDVYTTADSAGNHFPVRARMSNYDNAGRTTDAERAVPPMDENWTGGRPPTEPTCIRASFRPELVDGQFNWGAWYFMN